MFFISNISAQSLEQQDSFISARFGLSSVYTLSSGFSATLPPIDGTYEYMITENISIGGFIGVYSAEFEFNNTFFNDNESIKYSFFNIGALGNYHFVNNDQWNVYVGAALGYLSVGVDDNITDGAGDVRSSGIALGVQGGARYFFTDKFAANVQLGYGLAVLSLGVTLKL